jgi:hypothetical protein
MELHAYRRASLHRDAVQQPRGQGLGADVRYSVLVIGY